MKTLKGHHPKTSAKINNKFGRAIKKLGETSMKKQTLLEEFKKKFDAGYFGNEITVSIGEGHLEKHNMISKEKLLEWIEKALSAERKRVGEVIDGIANKKFPRGERKWCIECVKRIRKELKQALTKEDAK